MDFRGFPGKNAKNRPEIAKNPRLLPLRGARNADGAKAIFAREDVFFGYFVRLPLIRWGSVPDRGNCRLNTIPEHGSVLLRPRRFTD
jgi:hypothetical protein